MPDGASVVKWRHSDRKDAVDGEVKKRMDQRKKTKGTKGTKVSPHLPWSPSLELRTCRGSSMRKHRISRHTKTLTPWMAK